MGYRTEKLQNGALKVYDVELMGVQKLTEKHFKIKDIDRAWMERGLETFEANKAKGKLPYLWDRHNTKDRAAEVIGRLDNLRIGEVDGEPWYIADIIITDEASQQKFLAGKSPSKSVEFQPDSHYLRGLALLDGHEGHFDATIPDFVPEGLYEELVALGADAECTVLCHAATPFANGDIAMTKEELLAALADNNKSLLAEVDKKLAKAPKTGDIDVDLETVRQEERDRAAAQLAKVKRDAKIDTYSVALNQKTKTPLNLVRKKLESFESQEAMDLYYETSMSKKDEDVKLGIEREHGDATDLREEWTNYKSLYKSDMDFDTYKRLAENLSTPKNRNGKQVHAVKERNGAFA